MFNKTASNRCLFVVMLSLFGAVNTYVNLPAFVGVFDSFGAELPILTVLLLEYYPILFVFPVLTLAYCLYTKKRRWVSITLLLIAILIMPLVRIILYLPIFKLGAAV